MSWARGNLPRRPQLSLRDNGWVSNAKRNGTDGFACTVRERVGEPDAGGSRFAGSLASAGSARRVRNDDARGAVSACLVAAIQWSGFLLPPGARSFLQRTAARSEKLRLIFK